jgi:hypothetical protein
MHGNLAIDLFHFPEGILPLRFYIFQEGFDTRSSPRIKLLKEKGSKFVGAFCDLGRDSIRVRKIDL